MRSLAKKHDSPTSKDGAIWQCTQPTKGARSPRVVVRLRGPRKNTYLNTRVEVQKIVFAFEKVYEYVLCFTSPNKNMEHTGLHPLCCTKTQILVHTVVMSVIATVALQLKVT